MVTTILPPFFQQILSTSPTPVSNITPRRAGMLPCPGPPGSGSNELGLSSSPELWQRTIPGARETPRRSSRRTGARTCRRSRFLPAQPRRASSPPSSSAPSACLSHSVAGFPLCLGCREAQSQLPLRVILPLTSGETHSSLCDTISDFRLTRPFKDRALGHEGVTQQWFRTHFGR